ncbi:DUF417 family protein [Thalassotalea euphylliae]|uniref:DUF417 family protein n=1 Tax=Thalassotalea euphylliae TaxID=1655234 RepID=A0A3E0TY77_9GAMM|nr:DUF417 family protein [Thalassotalea euphylliae]REL28832.1 DUF417 family protein [Thalassotalea euphylliae]
MTSDTPNKLIYIFLLIAASLMAASTLMIGSDASITRVTDFYGLSGGVVSENGHIIAALTFALVAVLSALVLIKSNTQTLKQALGLALMVASAVPLITLFSEQRWIASLGGFPAIGSGQGIIKYFALLALGVHFIAADRLSITQQRLLQMLPVVLVLLWIGGMKFTELEAKGIEPLVASSPLMSWMYQLWSVQATSNLIGIYDLIALAALLLSLRIDVLFVPALLMSGAVMLTTQSFLFTWSDALSAETLLSSGGQFLIKDLWYLANLVFYYQLTKLARIMQ